MKSVPMRFRLVCTSCENPFARQAAAVRPRPVRVGELGRQHPAMPVAGDRPAGDLLRAAAGIGIGGVDEIDPGLGRRSDDPARLGFLGAGAEGHGAEDEARDGEAAAAEAAIGHRCRGHCLLPESVGSSWAAGRRPRAMKDTRRPPGEPASAAGSPAKCAGFPSHAVRDLCTDGRNQRWRRQFIGVSR